jgi:ribulose-bisphosphate carboxylase large chain
MTLPNPVHISGLSGERFQIRYRLSGVQSEDEAYVKANDICIEQTVEFPADLLPQGDICDQLVGHIEYLQHREKAIYEVAISYAVETAGRELTQLLNVIFGNSSIKPGIRVESLELPESFRSIFLGPRFGRAGLRDLLNAHDRPLLCTAIKPLGLSARQLADLAYKFALGGIDIIKDDHGLADQPFCPYRERVERCAESVARANRETGLRCIYMPNISTRTDRIVAHAQFAKQVGAGGLMLAPGLVGMDALRQIADDDAVVLPIVSHPAFQGSFVTSPENGISHYALYGQMMRLAGADAVIYPNYGGRFAFSYEECRQIVEGTQVMMGHIKSIFPTPGGGMSFEHIADMRALYGNDVIYLIGGGLHRHSGNIVESARFFSQLVQRGSS